ncbi:MAG: hypothetical protein ACOC7K_01950, partial [bacterium]
AERRRREAQPWVEMSNPISTPKALYNISFCITLLYNAFGVKTYLMVTQGDVSLLRGLADPGLSN